MCGDALGELGVLPQPPEAVRTLAERITQRRSVLGRQPLRLSEGLTDRPTPSTLARICVSHLQRDLVIFLDEFERFSQLLSGDDDASRLVQSLVGPIEVVRPGEQRTARTLLLSATPFKMYTLPDEPEGDDHYRDFLHTLRVLAGPERAQVVQDGLSEMRAALLRGDVPAATDAKDVAQVELRRVMARTERLAATADRDGMLTSHQDRLTVTRTDVSDYLSQAAVARALGSPDGLEYWRSSPHVFEMMERYHVKRRIDEELTAGAGLLREKLRTTFSPHDVNTFVEIDPGNPRARWLADDVLSTDAWRAAWLAPSLPYYTQRTERGVYADPAFQQFTKRLVFSAWGWPRRGSPPPSATRWNDGWRSSRRPCASAGTSPRAARACSHSP